ncbi:MAG TPA: 2-C-methyl-D-erythritol 4-phosphate cytidylyltransferase [Candidatus Limnocylindria bacterium]|nr:2-C-methyl-D-erythritol 4-phosphate cytidylyltransferase [Candidatus Limnocylindria bacterium]
MVAAAGRGQRLGPGAPKALRTVGGVPLLVHAVRTLVAAPSVDVVVVAAPADSVVEVASLLDRGLLDDNEIGYGAELHVVAGGSTRQESVAEALAMLADDIDVVLVHDAARALTPVSLVERVVAAVRAGADAVVPALAVTNTVKSVDSDEVVTGTLDRSSLRSAQTPQGFRRSVLVEANLAAAAPTAAGAPATDDAGLVERLGRRVLVVPGDPEAFKITRPLDLLLAQAILAGRASDADAAAEAES